VRHHNLTTFTAYNAASRGRKPAVALRHILLSVFLLLCRGSIVAQDSKLGLASLHGFVHDASGAPLANVSLVLQNKNSPTTLTTTTDAQGSYSFTGLSAGQYSLQATKKGYVDGDLRSLVIAARDAETQDFLLKINPVAATEFFDKPEFTVSGVVDTTALGGHGSDTVVRTREAIAKDTVKLSTSNAEFPGAPPDIENSLRAGDYKQAREQVRHLIASSDKAELHHLLADIDERTGDSLEAVHEYQRAAEMSPSEAYLFDWGSELLLHHAPEPAEEVFAKGNRLFPQSARMLIGLGAAAFARGSFDQAIERICQASDLSPNDPSAYLFLGKMQAAENVSSAALLDRLHRFVTTQPQNAQANYYYAVALWKQNRGRNTSDSEIVTLLSNAARLDPDFASAQLQLGIVKSEQGDVSGAIAHFARTIEIDPQNQEAHFRLSQAYRKQGQTEKAKQELQIYQELSKKSAEQVDRQRREIPQFVYTLRGQPPSLTP
jgi:Flp pilus assembly protein TadD